MPRRGENIRKRADGRWEGRYKPKGATKYDSVYGKTYTEVKYKLKMVSQEPVAKNQEPEIKLLKDMETICLEWLEVVKITLKQSSYAGYHTILTNHIIPYFKSTLPKGITSEMLQSFIQYKTENAKIEAKRVRDIFSVLIQIIAYCEKKEYISVFPMDIKLPKSEDTELPVLTKVEQMRLTSYLNANLSLDTIGILIALTTGIRLGELCAITWNDIDLEAETIRINKTVQRIKNTEENAKTKTIVIIDTPKSKKSIRTIPLPAFLIQILREYKIKYRCTDYFLTGKSRYKDTRTYQDRFKKILNNAGIEPTNFHACRHTFATRAIEAGADIKSLSEILGHSSVRFTLDRYVHSSNEQKKICIEKMVVNF